MNSSLLLGQLVLLVALVPTIYFANFYYNAYHAEREKGKRINGMLVLDKYLYTTELMNLQQFLRDAGERSNIALASAQLEIVCAKLQLVLDGNQRRLAEAKRAVA